MSETPLDQIPVPPGSSSFSRFPALIQDALIVLGVGLVILVLLMVWARYFRHRSRQRADLRVRSPVLEETGDSEADRRHHHHHRHRRRRREHRPRNPTLAQTGGLPPQRPEDELPQSP